jgi:hypothetical protein
MAFFNNLFYPLETAKNLAQVQKKRLLKCECVRRRVVNNSDPKLLLKQDSK